MATDQIRTTLTYNRPAPANTINLPFEMRLSHDTAASADDAVLEVWMSLNPAVIAKVVTIEITAGTTGNLYDVAIAGTSYIVKQAAGDTDASLATKIAQAIDRDTNVSAKVDPADDNLVRITGIVAGNDFSAADGGSTTPGNLTFTTATAASGTPLHRKIAELRIVPGIHSTGFQLELAGTATYYDGAATPAAVGSTQSATFRHRSTIDAIQTAQGVPQ